MRCLRYLSLPSLLWILLASPSAAAAPWKEDVAFFVENANASSAKVDAADLDKDGNIDLVFANTAGQDKGTPDSFQTQQAFRNSGTGLMEDISTNIFGGMKYTGRAVKLRDVDYDGDIDVVLGTTWFTASKLFLNQGGLTFAPGTVPTENHNVGDIDVGDIDLDGDLDLVLSNWGDDPDLDGDADGPGAGGTTLLWTQDGDPGEFGGVGSAAFSDATGGQMPSQEIKFSWDVDFIDFDNDYELDLVMASFSEDNSVYLYHNDNGVFSIVSIDNVQGKASADVEPWDLNGDSFLDLLTLQDGQGRRNRILTNDGNDGFVVDPNIWPMLENPGAFDFMGAFTDYNDDGTADLVLGAFQTIVKYPDRLMINEAGFFKQWDSGLPVGDPLKFQALEHDPANIASPGTYAIVLAHLNGDKKIDIAMGQYENDTPKKVFLGTDEVLDDTHGPVFVNYEGLPDMFDKGTEIVTRLRCHDNKSPLMLHDFTETSGYPYLETWPEDPGDPELNPGEHSEDGQWYGEYLWRIRFQFPQEGEVWWRLCAVDRFGNKTCTVPKPSICGDCVEPTSSTTDTTSDVDTNPTETLTTDATANTVPDTISGTISESETTETIGSASETQTPTESFTTAADDDATVTNTDTLGELDDDGCGCSTDGSPAQNTAAALAMLGLLGLRRRRR